MSVPVLFPYVPRLGNLDRTQPVGPMLVAELERRVQELRDKDARLPWELMQDIDPQVRITFCGSSENVTRCGWPVLNLETILPHAPRRVVKFFQDVDKQRSRAINRHVTKLEEVEVLVRDGAVVSDQLRDVLAQPSTAKGTNVAWCEMYKTVAYMYTHAESLNKEMQLPPVESVDLMAIRPAALDQPNTWLMLAMSVYHDSYKPSKDARRLELYGAYTQFEPIEVQVVVVVAGASVTQTQTHTRVTCRSCLKVTDAEYQTFMFLRISEECARLAATRAALGAAHN